MITKVPETVLNGYSDSAMARDKNSSTARRNENGVSDLQSSCARAVGHKPMESMTLEKAYGATETALEKRCLRQRKNLLACAEKLGLMSEPVRQPLACRTLYCKGRTFSVAVAKFDAVIVAEIVFRQIPMQMLLRAMLINAAHATLKN